MVTCIATRESPQIEDVVRASQGTSAEHGCPAQARLDRIIAFIESGQGSIGKLIYDPALYNQLNATVAQFQGLVARSGQRQGQSRQAAGQTTNFTRTPTTPSTN